MAWIILLGMILLGSISPVFTDNMLSDESQEYMSIVESYAERLKRLSTVGMNTSEAEHYINNALSLLGKSELTDEERDWIRANLTMAGVILDQLEREYSEFTFWRNFDIAAKVICLVSIPVLTYLFLPRIWALVWFKARRKWIIKKSRIK